LFIDTRIQEDVLTALRQDPRIKHPELLAVSVDEIGTVVLRGAVESLPERLAAAHDARHVDGVFDVIVDDVKVHPPLSHRRTDDAIRAATLECLTADARIRSTHIHVTVSHGHVTLSGDARDEAESAAALEDAAGVTGVVEVVNCIETR
jgi:osmotically-inducible protein OsmY